VKGEEVMNHGECLSDETLTDYLEGTLDLVVQATCEAHMIACANCRERLALYMRVLQPEITPEEDAALQGISEAWTNRNFRNVPVLGKRTGKRAGWYAVAAAVLVLLILGPAWIAMRWLHPTQTAHDLVQAMLSKERPFSAQLSGEPHRQILRSADSDPVMDFNSLSAEMSQRSANQYDIGRFHLIQKQFSEAIAALGDAARDPKATAAVHNDLGVAFMEQGSPENLARAEQEFHYAIQLDPEFAPAVFNLCLFYDRAGMPDEAKQERILYLTLDPTSGWADEVRLKLAP